MNHSSFNFDSHSISPDDDRYGQRLNSQHRVAFAPLIMIGAMLGGIFAALPFASQPGTDGFPLTIIPAGVVSVLILLGIGLTTLALVQGAWRFIHAFWTLRGSLEELPDSQRLLWYTFELGGLIMWFGVGFALAYLLV